MEERFVNGEAPPDLGELLSRLKAHSAVLIGLAIIKERRWGGGGL